MRINNNEQWAVIEDYPDYRVSNKGRVYSLKAKDFVGSEHTTGHIRITLSDRKQEYVHILVAKAFIKEYWNGCDVHHLDFDKTNNNVENLRCLTHKTHCWIHSNPEGPSEECHKLANEAREVKVEQWTKDGTELIKVWDSAAKAARALGISNAHITHVCTGKPYDKRGYVRKSAGGYYWKYHETNN